MKDQYDYKEPQEASKNFERADARHSRVPSPQPTARVLIRFPLLMSFVTWPESTCTFVILTNPRFGLPSSLDMCVRAASPSRCAWAFPMHRLFENPDRRG